MRVSGLVRGNRWGQLAPIVFMSVLLPALVGCGGVSGEALGKSGEFQSNRVQKLKGANVAPFDRMGYALAIEGGVLVASAQGSSAPGEAGAGVYVYELKRGQWTQAQRLTVENSSFVAFGHAVATNGELIAATAPLDDSNGGAVYLYSKDGEEWKTSGVLTSDGLPGGTRFGSSVAMGEGVIMVGDGRTAVHIFEPAGNSWQEVQVLESPDEGRIRDFGAAIDLEGELLAVGAPAEGEAAPGAAYVYRRAPDGWELEATVRPEVAGERFGSDVATIRGMLSVGSPGAGQSNGVYIYVSEGTDWGLKAHLAPPHGASTHFGSRVDLDSGIVVVGDPGSNASLAQGAGSSYLYVGTNGKWELLSTLTPVAGQTGDSFGIAVDLDGDMVTIGASGDDEGANDSGATYLYHLQNMGGEGQ